MVQGPREVEVDLLVCLLEGVAVGGVAELLGEFVGELVIVPDLVVAQRHSGCLRLCSEERTDSGD